MIDTEYRDYPSTSTTAYGRVWYGAQNRVYFTQTFIDSPDVLCRCYQNNDPTSPETPDILDTDGGEIQIQNSGRVAKIQEFQDGVLVFADRGVWYIAGNAGGFIATDYSVRKITSFPLISPRAVVSVGEAVFYASQSGIHRISPNDFGDLRETLISEQKVDDYILDLVSIDMFGVYDNKNKTILWVSPEDNKWVVHDLRLDAWFPQQFSSGTINTAVLKDLDLLFINTGTSNFSFGALLDEEFEDFGVPFNSYIVTNYDTAGDFSKKKGVPLMSAYYKRTESSLTGYDSGYTYDKPSGCLVQIRWDWNSSSSGGKWSNEVQMYNLLPRGFVPNSYPVDLSFVDEVISKKTKIRGRGKSFQIKFTSEDNKDMQILGYALEVSSRGRQ